MVEGGLVRRSLFAILDLGFSVVLVMAFLGMGFADLVRSVGAYG